MSVHFLDFLMLPNISLQLRIAHSTADLHVPTLPCGNPGGGCSSQTSALVENKMMK